MTEEQRMEEGRRMFQIFAARMFEQRVLNAYRQKVAEERQQKLIEELAEDEQLDAQREAKRAKEAQKKKDKRQKQKQAKDEEKARRDAEKAAEEAAARAIEEKKLEEQRQRKEEQRKKKESEKKAAEDERKRKEEEKQRQIQERKDQQAELERKQREQKEREKKKREEAKRKEREDREANEKEIREKKDRELAERKARESKALNESNAKERIKQDEAILKQATSAPKRQSPANAPPAITPISSSLLPPNTTSSHASPRLPIATPVLPKAPTPGRIRQKSFQDSRTTSPKPSQPASSSTASPAGSSDQQNVGSKTHSRKTSQHGPIQPPVQQSRFSPAGAPTSFVSQPPGFANMTPLTANGFPSTFAPPMSPMSQHGHMHHPPGFPNQYSAGGSHYRNNNIPYPPGINTARNFPPTQHAHNGPLASQGPDSALSSGTNNVGRFGMSHDPMPTSTHSRNQSTSSNISPRDPNPRPAPIQRPSSVTPHQQNENLRPSSKDVDDLSNHLGSSALLDDTDVAPDSAIEDIRRGGMAVGGPRVSRQAFGGAPGLAPIGTSARPENGQQAMNIWPNPQSAFGPPGRAGQPFASAPGFGRSPNGNAFGSTSASTRSSAPRALRIRVLVSTICDKWTAMNSASQGWHLAEQVCNELQTMMPRNEPSVFMVEMLQICDTEGNAQNGGGWFDYRSDRNPFLMKHYTGTDGAMNAKAVPPPGEIGTPNSGGGIGGNSLPPMGGQTTFQQPGGF